MMRAPMQVLLALLLAMVLALSGEAARADTPVSLFQAFRGQVNFTGTEETLRKKDNKQPCQLVNLGKGVSAYLGGIPSGATVLSAQLYWAGSGNKPVYAVNFDGATVTAPAARRYTSATSGTGLNYFSGAADVTSQVAAKGNGTYSFSGLSVDNGNPWCSAAAVVGGFSLLVVYSAPSEPYRLLNLYEGFQYFRNNGFTLTLNNFAIPDPLPSSVTGRIAHITWEGDGTLAGGGEDLLFNGYEMTDSINPSGNQFNSASNVTGDTSSYGIDFDAYTVRAPVIQPGQTSATTTYRSGQDLVLLGAEVAALPYVPTADLSMTMGRSGALQVGSTSTYTLTVTNNGADSEIGPVTVVDTLPAGLTLVSARGSGWTCSSAAGGGGQTIVTCSANGPVPSGAVMNALTIAVTPTQTGSYTNSATVSGQTGGDNNLANNTATNTASATGAGATVPLVFTARACADGEAVVQPGGAGCPVFTGPVTADTLSSGQIWMTSVSGSPAKATVPTPGQIAVQVALTCAPKSKVQARYAGATFTCGDPAQTVQLQFNANAPSAVLQSSPAVANSAANFAYADVGKLTLSLTYNNATTTLNFVSRPAALVVSSAFRSDNVADLHDPVGAVNPQYDVAFAKAGESFVLQVAAAVGNPPAGTLQLAPSFGCETTQTPPLTLTVNSPANRQGTLAYPAAFTRVPSPSGCTGLLQGTAQWYEAGLLTLTPSLADYLGTGSPVDGVRRVIGRFYPDHFTTSFAWPFACLPAMACPARGLDPANPVYGVSGAAYSSQPVGFTVTAYGLNRGNSPTVLTQYNPPQSVPVKLNAFSQPNGSHAAGHGSFPEAAIHATPQTDKDGNVTYALSGTVAYQLETPYDPARPRAGTWTAPQAVYLRATAQDSIMAAGQAAPQPLLITSQIAPTQAAPAPPQQEDGLMLVAGRVLVGNVFGSELAQVPLPLAAQYWTGTLWQTNTNDSDSVVATSLKFSNCKRSFAGNCQLTVLSSSTVPAGGGPGLQVASGSGRLVLKAPARGQNGSLDISAVNDAAANPGAATWLPSTAGRATFGLFKSPLIYLREVY